MTPAPKAESAAMQRIWTKVGYNYNATPEQRRRLAELFDRIDWQESGKDVLLPGVLQDIVIQFGLCRFSHFAISNELAPYVLYGVRNQYTNGHAEFYVGVAGSSGVTICVDFYPTTKQ